MDIRCGVENTSKSPDINDVLSITIIRQKDKTDIASITDTTPAKAYSDLDQITVYGDVSGSSGNQR